MHRSRVVEFLERMEFLNATKEEKQMADNYFSVLQGSGKPPQTWVDQGIELGGGQAFTVGTEGDERNRRHIVGSLSLWPAFDFFTSCGYSAEQVNISI